MNSDPLFIAAGLVAVGLVLVALLWPKGPTARPAASPKVHPGRALIDHFEEVGRDNAGRLIAERLGVVHADEIAAKFGRAFVSSTSPPPPPNG